MQQVCRILLASRSEDSKIMSCEKGVFPFGGHLSQTYGCMSTKEEKITASCEAKGDGRKGTVVSKMITDRHLS